MVGVDQITESHTSSKSNQTVGQYLMQELDQYLTTPEKKVKNGGRGKFYPSALGNSCDRWLWLTHHAEYILKSVNPVLQRVFHNGSYVENRFKSYFTKIGVLVASEVVAKIYDPVHISGRADFQLDVDGQPYIIEMKSINSKGWEYLNNGPKKEHAVQLQLYLNILDIDYGAVLYENKDTQLTRLFELKKSPSMFNNIIARAERIAGRPDMPKIEEVEGIHESYCDCKKVKDE